MAGKRLKVKPMACHIEKQLQQEMVSAALLSARVLGILLARLDGLAQVQPSSSNNVPQDGCSEPQCHTMKIASSRRA